MKAEEIMSKFTEQTLYLNKFKQTANLMIGSTWEGQVHIGAEGAGYTIAYTYLGFGDLNIESVRYDKDIIKNYRNDNSSDKSTREFFMPNIMLQPKEGDYFAPNEIRLCGECLETHGNDVNIVWASKQKVFMAKNLMGRTFSEGRGDVNIILPKDTDLYRIGGYGDTVLIAPKGEKFYEKVYLNGTAKEELKRIRGFTLPRIWDYTGYCTNSGSTVKVDKTRVFDRKTGEVKAKPAADTTRVR